MNASNAAPLQFPGLPGGTSYITVTNADGAPALRLQACTGRSEEYAVPVTLDELAAERALSAVARPVAVMIRRVGEDFDCTLIGASSNGPRTVAVSVAGALELARRGIHCVLRCDSAVLADAS